MTPCCSRTPKGERPGISRPVRRVASEERRPPTGGLTPPARLEDTGGLTPPARRIVTGALLALVFLLPACQQKMGEHAGYKPLTKSDFFEDDRSARPLVPGTVARGQLRDDPILYTGRDAEGNLSMDYPFPVTEAVLKRGQQRYKIFCGICHGLTGHGDGRIVQRGFTKPPSYITDYSRTLTKTKLINVPPGHIYEVITKGYGAMPSHAEQIPVKDRWAIVAYVRALQYAQVPSLRKKEGKQ